MSDWSCRQREARSHLRLFHLVLGSHDGRALVPIPKRSAYPASDLDVVVVDSLKALDPNRPIREVGHGDVGQRYRRPRQDVAAIRVLALQSRSLKMLRRT